MNKWPSNLYFMLFTSAALESIAINQIMEDTDIERDIIKIWYWIDKQIINISITCSNDIYMHVLQSNVAQL